MKNSAANGRMMKNKWIFLGVMLLLSIPQYIYRFKHPEMSETQLFLDFFKAYTEFFK